MHYTSIFETLKSFETEHYIFKSLMTVQKLFEKLKISGII